MMERKSRVLIVDDEPDFAEALGFLLAEHNFSIDWAFSGLEAKQRIDQGEFDYVITDFFMPGLNGYQLYNMVHETMSVSPKFIVISGDVNSINSEKFNGSLLSIFPKTTHYRVIVDCLRDEEKNGREVSQAGA